MKFKVEMDVEVRDHDANLMGVFPEAIKQRFDRTAVHINRITVTKIETETNDIVLFSISIRNNQSLRCARLQRLAYDIHKSKSGE